MAKALFAMLVLAALGVTGYYTYSYVSDGAPCCHSETMAVKKSCCQTEAAKPCCSESGECTGACTEAKTCDEKKEGCSEAKEGGCCKEKKDEAKKDDGKKE